MGTNELIQRGAKLVRSADDILCEYQGVYRFSPQEQPLRAAQEPVAAVYQAKSAPKSAASQDTLKATNFDADPILAALESGPLPLDTLLERTQIRMGEALAQLTLLELKGRVRQLPGRVFELIGTARHV